MDNGADHFIEICLRKTGFLRPARIKTLHDPDFEKSSHLLVVLKIITTIKPGNI